MSDDPREPADEQSPIGDAEASAVAADDDVASDEVVESVESTVTDAEDAAVPAEHDAVDVQVRTRPRYGRFMALGTLLGFIGGWVVSNLGGSGPWLGSGQWTDTSVVLPFMMLFGAVVGLVLGAVVAIVLDRIVGRRARSAIAERTRHHG